MELSHSPLDVLIDILQTQFGIMSEYQAVIIAREYPALVVIVVYGINKEAKMFLGDLNKFLRELAANTDVHEVFIPEREYDWVCAIFGVFNKNSTNQSKLQLN